LLKSGLLGVIGISIFNIGILHFLRKSDIHITTIGKDSFLLNGWLITKNDLRD